MNLLSRSGVSAERRSLSVLHAAAGILPAAKKLAFAAFVAAVLVAGCSRSTKEPAAEPAAKPAEPESRVKHGTNGEVVITLDAATQKVMGLQTTALAAAELRPELKAYGRVLDPSPLGPLVAELITAQAASQASQAELRRLQTLAGQSNASERSLQTAEASAARDQMQAESTRLRLISGWGSAIAEHKDLPALVRSLGSLDSVLVEVDLPAGEAATATPRGARLVTLADDSKPIEAQLIGPATVVDPQMQGRGYLFLVTPNPSHLAPGAAVTGFLSLPGEAQSGVSVPREAVVRFNGTTWVYVQTGGDTFQRTEAALDRPLEKGWFVREGLKPQDKVVTTGAQELLSEELKGQVE
jgi:multidrug efflux pump subunit AcrA (membrane-fusion protein)